MEYNSGSNRASNFRSAERVSRGRFEITSTINTPGLYDTNSSYQLIVSITNLRLENVRALRRYIFNYQFCKQWRNSCKKNPFQCTWLTRARSVVVQLQLSNFKTFKLDSCNWTPSLSPSNYVQIGARRANHNRAFCYRYDYGRNWLTWLSLLSTF